MIKFNDHADYLCKKISKKVGFLSRIGKFISSYTLKLIYNSILLPHFTYCSTILYICNEGTMSRLQKLQNRGMHIILKCNRYTKINEMLKCLDWLNVKELVEMQTMLFIFKMIKGKLPSYLGSNFLMCSDIHCYNTRGRNKYYINSRKKNVAFNSIFVKGMICYSNLDEDIRNSHAINIFRKRMKLMYISNR